jgi:hypothetical protein
MKRMLGFPGYIWEITYMATIGVVGRSEIAITNFVGHNPHGRPRYRMGTPARRSFCETWLEDPAEM